MRGLLGLSQSTYIEEKLKEFSISLSKKGFIPIIDRKAPFEVHMS